MRTGGLREMLEDCGFSGAQPTSEKPKEEGGLLKPRFLLGQLPDKFANVGHGLCDIEG